MSIPKRFLTLGLVAAFIGVAVAADDEPQTIKAGGITFKAPAAWKSERPSNAMRKAQIKVSPVTGDEDPAELVITQLSGEAGGMAQNIKRWESQFLDGEKATPKAKVEEKKGTNVDVTRIEIAGRYVAAMMPGQAGKNDKPNYRLLGAIVMTKDSSYFFKMVGPEKTVAASAKAFDAMIESMTLEK